MMSVPLNPLSPYRLPETVKPIRYNISLAPDLERDVYAFLTERTLALGGKALEQRLEELRISVEMSRFDQVEFGRYLAQCE